MVCPKCHADAHHVLDTRDRDTREIYRRRECTACGHRWTTYELFGRVIRRVKKLTKAARVVERLTSNP